jgi:hypothetical protein
LMRIIKRVMYAEGDTMSLKNECAEYLKQQLKTIVD